MRDFANVQPMRVQAREEAVNAHAFDRILCNSRFTRESILRIYGREARVCYLGIDTDAFRPTGAAKEGYVIGLGTFGHHKGIDIAIRAVATIDPAARPRPGLGRQLLGPGLPGRRHRARYDLGRQPSPEDARDAG